MFPMTLKTDFSFLVIFVHISEIKSKERIVSLQNTQEITFHKCLSLFLQSYALSKGNLEGRIVASYITLYNGYNGYEHLPFITCLRKKKYIFSINQDEELFYTTLFRIHHIFLSSNIIHKYCSQIQAQHQEGFQKTQSLFSQFTVFF